MKTSWLELDVTGECMPAFLVEPERAARAGVIVLQEIFGVNADIQRVAELVAHEGYLALAPALFHRTDPHFEAAHDEAGFAKGSAAAGAVDLQQLVSDLTASAEALHARLGAAAPLGTWGFCFGGSIAFLSATLPFVRAAVSFYGGQIARPAGPTRPALLAMSAQVRAPLLLAFGGRDAYITAQDVEAIRVALDEHEKAYDLRVYDDEDHGFFRSGPGASDGAREAWERVRAFLSENLA